MITAGARPGPADRSYVLDSLKHPPFLAKYWEQMVEDVRKRAR